MMLESPDGNRRSLDQLVMQGGDVFTFTQTVVPRFLEGLLSRAGTRAADVPWFFLHQANAFILRKIAERLKVSEDRVPHHVVSRYGNSSSATIPVTIATTFTTDTPSTKVCLCGFGGGLSWGGGVLPLGPFTCCDLIEYPNPPSALHSPIHPLPSDV